MLVELSINNFAIIDRLSLSFAPGFNVMTGETGAGKSIIIDAVAALLGGKVGPELIRAGADAARVEGIFQVSERSEREDAANGEKFARLSEMLTEQGIEWNDGELILTREINRSGRSVSRLNGRAITQGVLQQVGDQLIDIHGQTEHLSLLRVSEHIDFLDRFGNLFGLRSAVGTKVATLRQLRKELSSVQQDERERARRMDLLRYQVEEIAAAKLREGEDEELLAERRILANAEELARLAAGAYEAIQGDSEGARGALDLLGQVVNALGSLTKLDESLREEKETSENLYYQLEDLAGTLRAYGDNVEYNPVRLQEVEERLDLLRSLKKKYGSSVVEVLAYGKTATAELDRLAHSEERAEELRAVEQELRQEIGTLAGELSQKRREAGVELAQAIEREVAELNMAKARFEVHITQSESPNGVPAVPADSRETGRPTEGSVKSWEFDGTGIDRVEFYIATNPGEPVKPLAKVASGGETSRLMLAMKSVLSRADATPTLIFDEVDVGVGGRSGQVVGEKLWGLAGGHQVICVTHLPQIAAFGDAHFRITKTVSDRTRTEVQQLASETRITEVAEMMGGETAKTRASAQEMLQRAEQWKQTSAAI